MMNQKSVFSVDQLANLNDVDLARAVSATHNQAVVNEFYRRFGDIINQEASRACSFNYDPDLDYEEKTADTLSEAYIAADNALSLYNGTSPLGAFLRSKIRFHFMDLQRKNAGIRSREPLLSQFEGYSDDDETSGVTDYIEARIAGDKEQQRARDAEAADSYKHLLRYAKPGQQAKCVETVLEAYASGAKSPVQYAAEKLGCSRQQVYNHLHALKVAASSAAAGEVEQLFE